MATVSKYDPWDLLEQFQREVNGLVAQGRQRGRSEDDDGSRIVTSQWAPAVDIREESDRFVILADIPGVQPADIEITMDRGVLSIKGERKPEERTENHRGHARVERIYGTFYRRFSLPDSADPERIKASGNHGVLEVVIPKREQAQPKRIEVS